MKGIRIIKVSKPKSWYVNEVGNVFGVIRETEDTYVVKEGKLINWVVKKCDCEEVIQ